MRLRLPAVRVRGEDDLSHAPASAETEGADEKAAPVRDDQGPRWRRPASGARTMATRLRPLYPGAAARGAGLSARRRRATERWWWLPGAAFAAVTQAPALLAAAWLVPGTALLLAGRLLPVPMLIIFVPLAVAFCYFAMRRLPVAWPRFGNTDDAPAGVTTEPAGEAGGARRGDVPVGALLALVAIAAGFGIWQAVFRSEPLFSVGDPSVYLQYGYWIAEHGTARIPEVAGAFGGDSAGNLSFGTAGFSVSGSSVTPAFLPGLPLVLAAGTWLGSVTGALLMPAVLGGCAVLSFGGLVGRLCGAWWGTAAALVLALGLPEVYAARTPLSEPLVQVLLFGGLCLLIDSMVKQRNGPPGLAQAGLGGLALGLTVVVSIGSLGVLLPAFPVLAFLFVTRKRQAGPFGLGLFLGIGLGLAVGLVLARSYLSTVSDQLHLIGVGAAAFGAVTVLVTLLAFPAVRAWLRRASSGRLRFTGLGGDEVALPSLGTVLQWLALAVPVLVLVGLTIRPYFQTVRGQTNPAVIRQVASLQRLAGLDVDPTRQYYESSLDWVLWYLGVPAVLLACAGAAVLGRRSVRVMLERSSPAAVRLWGLPFILIVWSVVAVLWDPSVVPWQPLASHRLVPVVLPGLLLLAVWVSSRLASRASAFGASRTAIILISVCCLFALVIPPLVTTLNPGLAAQASVGQHSSGISKLISRVQLRGVGASATYGGSLTAAAALCTAVGPSASVVFVDAGTAAAFAPTVRDLCDEPTATLAPGSSSTLLEQAVTDIERADRRPVLLGTSRASVALFGIVPKRVISLQTRADAEVLTGPPAGNWPVTYTLWMASPLR